MVEINQTGPILHPEMPASTMGMTRNLLKGDPSVWSIFMPRQWNPFE
jgi:hypothetical protein